MPLNLYRRHYDSGRCYAGHTPDSQTYESDERRPKWKKCACPIYASGRLRDHPKFRKNTKRITWAEAKAVADRWERGDDEPLPPPPAPHGTPPPPVRKTVTEAVEAMLTEYRTNGSAIATLRRYQTVLKRFREFSEAVRGYQYLDQWTCEDVRDFRRWWRGSSVRTHNTNFAHVKHFFTFCQENSPPWIATNPARFRTPRNRQQAAAQRRVEKSPYTDAELARMLDACYRLFPQEGPGPRKFYGQDMADFILISAYTGLRISDMALFHASRLTPEGDVHLRALKNGNWVDTWVPEWLQERIRARALQYGPYIFGARTTRDPVALGCPWRLRLAEVWNLCGPWEEKPTHHRFRHTFVRILLEIGTPVPTVAELLGDTEEVVRKAYSKWVSERQQHVRQVLQQAFTAKPRLQLVR
jgi:integrase